MNAIETAKALLANRETKQLLEDIMPDSFEQVVRFIDHYDMNEVSCDWYDTEDEGDYMDSSDSIKERQWACMSIEQDLALLQDCAAHYAQAAK